MAKGSSQFLFIHSIVDACLCSCVSLCAFSLELPSICLIGDMSQVLEPFAQLLYKLCATQSQTELLNGRFSRTIPATALHIVEILVSFDFAT